MGVGSIYNAISPRFRRRRFERFVDYVQPKPTDRILDVGGYPGTWSEHDPVAGSIDMLNTHEADEFDPEEFPDHQMSYRVGDGCALDDVSDGEYDIVFSNSVIEHVGDWEKQKAFASEMLRVGKKVWIQTPNYHFPIEPHALSLGLHWLPRDTQMKVFKWISLWPHLQRGQATEENIRKYVYDIWLLKKSQMEELFPGCEILHERVAGTLTKSFVAARKSNS